MIEKSHQSNQVKMREGGREGWREGRRERGREEYISTILQKELTT